MDKKNCTKIDNVENKDVKLPHTGWNEVKFPKDQSYLRILVKIKVSILYIAFVSITFQLTSVYYLIQLMEMILCLQKDNIYGVQFHPEKSRKRSSFTKTLPI